MQIKDINPKCWHKKVRVIAYLRKVKAVINMPGSGSEDSLAIANIINKHVAQIQNINLWRKFRCSSNSLPVSHSTGSFSGNGVPGPHMELQPNTRKYGIRSLSGGLKESLHQMRLSGFWQRMKSHSAL